MIEEEKNSGYRLDSHLRQSRSDLCISLEWVKNGGGDDVGIGLSSFVDGCNDVNGSFIRGIKSRGVT